MLSSAQMPTSQVFNEKFMRQHVWLFLTDILCLDERAFNGSYEDYEKREPGYAKSTLTAYQNMFKDDKNNALTPQFILEAHKDIMSHLPKANNGKYKNEANNYRLGIVVFNKQGKATEIGNVNGTLEGFWELFDTWMLKTKNPIHHIHFKSRSTLNADCFIMTLPGRGLMFCEQVIATRVFVSFELFDKIKHKEKIEKYLSSHATHQCHINSCAPDVMRSHTQAINKLIEQHLQIICDEYNSNIVKARSSREKLRVILVACKSIVQLHGFSDGNTRLSYALLNYLLYRNKMPLTILNDPNRLDGFSVDQLIGIVEKGSKDLLLLSQGQYPNFLDKYSRYDLNFDRLGPKEVSVGSSAELVDSFLSILEVNCVRQLSINADKKQDEEKQDEEKQVPKAMTHSEANTDKTPLADFSTDIKKTLCDSLGPHYEKKYGKPIWEFDGNTAILKNKVISAPTKSEAVAKANFFKNKFKPLGLEVDLKQKEGSNIYSIVISNIDKLNAEVQMQSLPSPAP